MFVFFLYIYSTQLTIVYFLTTFIIFKILDYFWLWSSKREYQPTGIDKIFVDTWMNFNLVEIVVTSALIGLVLVSNLQALPAICIFIVFRVAMRITASIRYKKVHFV